MTTIVTDKCDGCRFTDCVTVCPVACFHGDDRMLYIDNVVCIQCGACIAICPLHAIYADEDIPEDQQHWIEINAERCATLPLVSEKQEPLPGAEERKAALGY